MTPRSVILLTIFAVVSVITTEGMVPTVRNDSADWDPIIFNDTDFVIDNEVYKIKTLRKDKMNINPTKNGSKIHHHHTSREDDDHYAVLWFIVYFVLGFVIFKVCHKCLYLPCFDRFFDYLDESYRANHNNIVLNSGRRGRDQVVVRYSRSEHVIVDNLYPGDSIQSPRSRPVNVDNGPQREQPGAEKDDTKNRQVNCDGYSKLLDEVD